MRAGDLVEYAKRFKDPEEPVFVLRAQDKTAPTHVVQWTYTAEFAGVEEEKIEEAFSCFLRMTEWQREHGSKIPD